MVTLSPFEPEEQFNIYEFEDYVSQLLDEATGEPFPSMSYRLRWNERTASWECDWFDQDGEPIDQGRRLSTNNFMRTPWYNGTDPDPMPAWLAFIELGDTGDECDFDGLGNTHEIVEFTREEIAEFLATDDPLLTKVGGVITVP